MPGEFDLIDWLRAQHAPTPNIPIPLGDDLAAVKWNGNDLLLVGVDQVLDGVHFKSAEHAPKLIARKVMNRNLSDCAAMACLPVYAVATFALPQNAGIAYARELFHGLREAADPHKVTVVGGDTATWLGPLAITVTILGKSDGVPPISRSGAKIGDGLYVTGPLGGSILGRHLTFEPKIRTARHLAQTSKITSMIDLSDGLSRDLAHICQLSKVGAMVRADLIPIHDDAHTLSKQDGISPIDHALHDGEDHELLFTTPDEPLAGTRIGTITAGTKIFLRTNGVDQLLERKGWEHKL